MKITLYWPEEDQRLLANLKWLAEIKGESLSLLIRKMAYKELTQGLKQEQTNEAQT